MARFFFLGFFLFQTISVAQISPCVSADRPEYDLLDRLEAYGCALPRLRAFRPQNHIDLRDSLFVSENAPCEAPEWLLLERRAFENPAAPALVEIQPLFLYQDVTRLNGLEASVTPLLPLRGNRPTANGGNLFFELTAGGEGGGNLKIVFAAKPGWVLSWQDYQSLNGLFYLQEGYLKVGYRQTELLVGRLQRKFGEAKHGDLALSLASAPLDSLQFSIVPHVIEAADFLGPFFFQTYLARLGDSRYVKNSLLWVVGLGVQPWPWLEIDLQERNQIGGDTVPSPSFSDLASILVYSGDNALDKIRHRSFSSSISVWLPNHFAKAYFQTDFDSLHDISSWLEKDISVITGLYLPHVYDFDFRLEYIHTVSGAFQSPLYGQGFAALGAPLGSPLGPDGEGIYLDLSFPAWNGLRLGLSYAHESRFQSASGSSAPENRDLLGVDFERRWDRLALRGRLICGNIANQSYVPGSDYQTCGGHSQLTYLF